MKKQVLGWALGSVVLSMAPHALGQCRSRAALTNFDRNGFVAAAYGLESQVTLEMLSADGCYQEMLVGLGGLGAEIRYSDQKVGYALVTLPQTKILDALDIRGIAFAKIARVLRSKDIVPAADRRVAALPAIEIPISRVATSVAKDGPYFPADEAGLTRLWKEHPGADGRGVRVAVVDDGIDLLHPEIEKVADVNDVLSPKVTDIEVVTAPDENDNWVPFGDTLEVKHGTFTAAEHIWVAPADGTYRFGIYERKLVLGPEGNSHTRKLTISVGVLWDEHKGRVWIDTDGDGDFRNETSLTDYAESQAIAYFGRKEGPVDNRIPFGVKIDKEKRAVYVAVATGGHGTHVSGPLAGNRLTGGLFDGAAPNAQLVDVVYGATQSVSALKAFARSDVDVVNRSGGIARYLNDDRDGFERHILERAVAVYDKPIVSFSAGNNLLLINDYVSAEMLRRNRQTSPPYVEAMNSFVWFKPDGVVNTVLGPSGSLGIQSRYLAYEWEWQDGRRRASDDTTYASPAPAGYMINSNNSPTIPIISGIFADLISEARRDHVRYTAARLYQALTSSARLLPGFPISEQGYGVVNAAAAWDRLAKMATADDPSNPVITSFSVSRKEHGQEKPINGFSEESSNLGDTVRGELWVTRHGGYAGKRAYRLALRGETETFKLALDKVVLRRDRPTPIQFTAKVAPKWRVAFLQLIDAKAEALMEEVPLSVQGPDVPERVSAGVEKYVATTPARRDEYGYVYLGENVQAARFSLSIPFQGPEGISGRHLPPRFRNSHDAKVPAGEPVDAAHHVGPIESFESLFQNTKPGIQNFYWENRGSHAEYETPYDAPPAATVPITGTLTVTKYVVALSKTDAGLTLTNKLADIEGKVEIYDAKLANSDAEGQASHATLDVERSVRANLSQWRISISSPSLTADAADLFLLNCTNKKEGCFVAAQKPIGAESSTFALDDPKEGIWRIVVRTRDSVNKGVKYEIREAYLTPSAIAAETCDSKHASGATWSVALPPKHGDAQYAAFHIAGSPGPEGTQNDGAKNGVRIALTPLDSNAP